MEFMNKCADLVTVISPEPLKKTQGVVKDLESSIKTWEDQLKAAQKDGQEATAKTREAEIKRGQFYLEIFN